MACAARRRAGRPRRWTRSHCCPTTGLRARRRGLAMPPPPAPPPVTATCPRGGAPPAPWAHFGGREDEPAVGFPPELRGPLLAAGFSAPTPVQAHAWPALCAGRDLIAVAQTGSGKTLAYLLPVAAQLGRAAPGVSPAALVVAPTRELVCQIEQQAERFRKSAGLACAAVYGGAPKGPQLGALHAGPALVVATPGRLVDFLDTEQSSCSLSGVRFLIFDEADRMLDDGFDEQVRRVGREAAGARRQTAMFSATWPPTVQELARDFLQDPISIRVGHTDELSANADVAQDVEVCQDDASKERALVAILRGKPRARAIVFVATKRACRDLARSARGAIPGWSEVIHGDRSQVEREAALDAFRSGRARVLFATDVAGRGLDIQDVALVVNFDPPRSAEDYVHRIGRTGRAGHAGLAITLLTWRDTEAARFIAEVMRRTGKRVPGSLERLIGPALVVDQPGASRTGVMTRHEHR
ncbi:unnamed protein product [Prorocentrum cordatum]|uniref:RNA helicase n=1 Tax=Prorocentrum cordatum TaxID=2364126 RepID=A0ABN9RZV0_9DINO|nr:unnamed protein product [Polarella glacialis]